MKKIFRYCIATTQTPMENIHTYSFMSRVAKVDIPKISFNEVRLAEMKNAINYMLGQLKPVHAKSIAMCLQEGFKKYDHTDWTSNKNALFSLYYLGVSTFQLPAFEPAPNSNTVFFSPINRLSSLEPTLSPNDPNFPAWCAENDIME